MKIHPTAIISPQAILGENVEIGPHVIVEADVEIGSNCIIQAHSVLARNTVLGEENFVGYGCILGTEPQDLAFQSGTNSKVSIGHRNKLKEYVTIHRGTEEGSVTSLGDDNFLMSGAHLGHNCVVGNRTIIINNALLGGYVTVEDSAVLGGSSIYHQHIRVGKNAMVRGGAGFGKDIPPYTIGAYVNIIAGLNSIGLKRSGFTVESRLEIKRAFKIVYLSGLNITQALEAAQQENWAAEAQHFFDFIKAAKKRGICRYERGKNSNDED